MPRSRDKLRYAILDRPPIGPALLLGFQQYLVMLGSTVLIPSVVVPPMGASPEDLAAVINTIFFASGIITLLQTFFGDRLPIIQGGSFAYISPALAITGQIKASMTFPSEHARFLYTMRVVSGGVIGSGLIVFLIGALGVIQPVLRIISPLTVAVNIAVLSLALTSAGFPGIMPCPHLGFIVIFLMILFSQFMRRVAIPLGRGRKWHVFELCPVILALLLSWFIAWILTISGVYNGASTERQAACRTDQSTALATSPWFRVPYPGQWGAPIVTAYSTFTMLAGALPAMIESLGDYYVCSHIAEAPVPPPDVLSRAISWQGLTCVLAGLFGTSSGTTAYNENIGAIQITRVGSRMVVQLGAVIIIIVALVGKFGGLFASLPSPLISGLFCIMFGLIAAVGLSMTSFTDQRSERNIFLVGFGMYMSLSVAQYFTEFTHKNGRGPIQTGNDVADNVLNSLFATAAAVALILTVVLDNTIPGTDSERGLTHWRDHYKASRAAAGAAAGDLVPGEAGTPASSGGGNALDGPHWWDDDRMNAVYGLPFGLTRRWERAVGGPLRARARRAAAPAAAALAPVARGVVAVLTLGGRCGPQPEPEQEPSPEARYGGSGKDAAGGPATHDI